MKKLLIMMAALTFSLALFTTFASANPTPRAPAPQEVSAEEAAAYKAWYEANQAKDYPKALELAKAYLAKFPNGNATNVAFLKKWVPQVRGMMYGEAAKAKNINEMIRIGKEVLAEDPDNLDYLLALIVQIRTNELSANPANYSHAAEATDFSERSIRLLEAGKSPTAAGTAFKKDPTLAYLHGTLAVIADHDKNVDKALAEYDKAGQLDSTNATFYFHCGRIHNDKYAAAAQNYQKIPEADRDAAEPKPEVKAALEEVNKQADAVITCWARFLGLAEGKPDFPKDTQDKIRKALTDLYKYRHPDSTDGLQKLIDQNKGAPPASNGSAAAATKP